MRTGVAAAIGLLALQCCLDAQVPQPFPRPGAPQTSPAAPARPSPDAQPAAPATAAQAPAAGEQAPTEAQLGLPIYAGARFLASYDAGQGQRYYLFGSDATFATLVKYYQTVLRTKGSLVFETPATQVFEVGKFDEKTMAFPPGVTVKDYTWGGSPGYLNPKRGDTPERFPTVLQFVRIPPAPAR